MMHWNHRVIRHEYDGETWYSVHEVYYRGEHAESCTAEPVRVSGDTLDELRCQLQHMLAALDRPVLDAFEVEPTDDGPSLYEAEV